MKTIILPVLLVVAFLGVDSVAAQDDPPAERPREAGQPADIRSNALRQLGLTPDQMQQIRRLNQTRKPVIDAAHVRLRQATRALDAAIYAEQANDTDVQARLAELQKAHSEVQRIRFTHEFAVRRVLTPEQLSKFRDIRSRFDNARQDLAAKPGEVRGTRAPGNGLRPIRPAVRQMLKQRGQRPE